MPLELTVDATTIPPYQRHLTILRAWADLEKGQAMVLLNDHDPLPLYYQFACEHEGSFKWEYLEKGPDLWRFRISKGNFEHPGFVPAKTTVSGGSLPLDECLAPRVLDTRPIFSSGQTPCDAIDTAAAALLPGQSLVLLVPFEPVPLYTKFGQRGFRHRSEQLSDDTWRIEFTR